MGRASGKTLLVAACVVMAAGCAAARTTPGAVTAVSRTAPARTPPAATPRERAVADAAAILRAFVLPPGGQRLAKAPEVLKFASATVASTSLVDDVSFWRAPGQPQAVLAWEQAHLPRRFTPGGESSGPPAWDSTFALAPVPGVLNDRDLVVEAAAAGNGQTLIRVDAQVSWQPVRPAAERVPAAARVVTITQLPGLARQPGRLPAPVTITGLAVVRRLAALADGLELSTIGDAPCPLPPGGGIRLTFLARAGGPQLAVAQGPQACGTVQFSVGGKPQPALDITDSFIPQVLRLAGLHWKVL